MRMGEVPDGEVGPGAAMAIPTGGLLPRGADAVVMVEHTTEPMPGTSSCCAASRPATACSSRARRPRRATCSCPPAARCARPISGCCRGGAQRVVRCRRRSASCPPGRALGERLPAGRARPSTATPCAPPTPTRRPRRCPRSSRSPARSPWAVPRGRGRAGRGDGDPDRRAAPARRRRGRDGRAHDRADARATSSCCAASRPATACCSPARRRCRATCSRRPGRPLRAADLGLLAAAGVTELAAHARPRVGIVSTGDEVVPPAHARRSAPGQVRDACAPALAGLVREAGGEPVLRGIVPDDAGRARARARRGGRRGRRRRRLRRLLGRRARPHGDRRRAARRGRLPRAGDQARQADAAGRLRRRAADRAAGQPALRARRLPPRRRPARAHGRGDHGAAAAPRPCGASWRATSPAPRDGSTSSRSTVRDGVATPRFGSSALLGPMVRRRRLVPRARGRHRARRAGTEVDVELYG